MPSFVTDSCYVCGVRFIDSEPPGSAIKELHHIVPRAYGGAQGPLVSLCATCHSKVHLLANSLPEGNPELLNGLNNEQQSRLAYLANVIYNSKKMAIKDINKLLPISFKISREEAQRVDLLKKVLNVNSRREVYRIAVDRLFNLIAQKS